MPHIIESKKNPRGFLHTLENSPKHIAFIMDGNRRFAQKQGKETVWGHQKGMTVIENILHWAYLAKVKHITIYAFSTENFNRDSAEVDSIFELLEDSLRRILNDEKILRKNIKIRMIGESENIPQNALSVLRELEEKTEANSKMYLNIALAYGGRNDIAQAFEKIAASDNNKNSEISISDEEISQYLFPYSDEIVPSVDLLIRTGNEHRTSNFLPWQANGNNAIVCYYEKFWPEFNFKDLFYLLRRYQKVEKERHLKNEKRLKKVNAFLNDVSGKE